MNKPAKVARCTLVSIPKHADVLGTDNDDLATQLAQDKKLSPRKVRFCNSPSRSKKPMMRSSKVNGSKPHYDPIKALNMRQAQPDTPWIKHEQQQDVVQFGC